MARAGSSMWEPALACSKLSPATLCAELFVSETGERGRLPGSGLDTFALSRRPVEINPCGRRASGRLPQPGFSAVREVGGPLRPAPHTALSAEPFVRPEIRVHHDAPSADPCGLAEMLPSYG